MDLWQRIRAYWEADELDVPTCATEAELQAFEQRYGVVLPTSMREYFLVADGNGDMGNDYFTFWPIRDVKLVSEELESPIHTDRLAYPQCFVFADYLLWCWAYAIYLPSNGATEGPVYLIGGKPNVIVANSFLEFMEKYAADPNSLL